MMTKTMKRLVPLLLAAAVSAQGGTVYLSFDQHSTQNLFQTREAVSEQISAFSLALEHDVSALSLLANVEYSAFRQTDGLSFLAADLGLDYHGAVRRQKRLLFRRGRRGGLLQPGLRGLQLARRQLPRRLQDLSRPLLDPEAPVAGGLRVLPGRPVRFHESHRVPVDR
ncbi:MAG: hypothetical protein MZW92_67345 [Comamonadaceae bacterium]|nr:hypothetical protein [Comamonadaceae bacterium]